MVNDLQISCILMGNGLIYSTDDLTVIKLASKSEIPQEYYLSEAYPNPFNSTTRIEFALPEDGLVKLNLYDVSGRLVKEIRNEHLKAVVHRMEINSGDLSAGLYFIRMNVSEFKSTKKVVLVK